jgi:hypothetical protein
VLPQLLNGRRYIWRVDEVNASGRTPGDLWTFTTKPLKADFNFDGDVDLEDFAHLQLCFSGVDVPQTEPECLDAHLDGDTDVDSADAGLLQGCLSGPGVYASSSCMP